MLVVEALETAYGQSQVLFGVSFEVAEGAVASLLGRNGMGKTTTVHSILGIVQPRAGSIRLQGRELRGAPAYRAAQAGIGLVPEGRQIFPNLTVYENLVATAANRLGAAEPWTLERVFGLFPQLQERRRHFGNQLSGGEQQMLAIGRALMTNPRLLILDEATEGLAPKIAREIWDIVRRVRESGIATVIVDKNFAAVSAIADRSVVLVKGEVVFEGQSAELKAQPELRSRYLGV